MSDQVRAEKQQWRQRIKCAYSETRDDQRLVWSESVCRTLSQHPLFANARSVLLFHSLSDEVQLAWLLETFSKEKQLYLPRVEGDDLKICPYYLSQCQTGSYGILEPDTEPMDQLDRLDLIIIPGLAFDRKGGRLGRGKGYYDRFLEKVNTPLIGVCFPYQLVEELPVEIHDKKISVIITPEETITL